ncbi:MAG TPA: hypothetical protein PKD62_12290, partial [Amaricoccus sp.]|nr:hypothetical protein [Amaricoccus sp.]
TLIMRPFNFDTLAVQAPRLPADQGPAPGGGPGLGVVAIGLLPVILVCRRIGAAPSRRARTPPPPVAPDGHPAFFGRRP